MNTLLKQYGDLKAQETNILDEIGKLALQDLNEMAADIAMDVKQKTASVEEFIFKLMDEDIVIDGAYEKQYMYQGEFLKMNFNLLHTLYITNGGILMSTEEMRHHLNLLGYPKNVQNLSIINGPNIYDTLGYTFEKLYKF